VIESAEREGKFEALVLFLRMARTEVKEAIIENELIYSLAKTGALGDLEEFIAIPNVANIEGSGQRCFDEVSVTYALKHFAHNSLLVLLIDMCYASSLQNVAAGT
jgi:Region in Clathrin and VPS